MVLKVKPGLTENRALVPGSAAPKVEASPAGSAARPGTVAAKVSPEYEKWLSWMASKFQTMDSPAAGAESKAVEPTKLTAADAVVVKAASATAAKANLGIRRIVGLPPKLNRKRTRGDSGCNVNVRLIRC